MNYLLVLSMVGRILALEAIFMVAPLTVSIYYSEPLLNIFSFLVVIAILLAIAYLTSAINIDHKHFGVREGFAVVVFSWIFLSFFGAFPFLFSGQIPNFVDAYFETMSGFTTTGASVLPPGDVLPKSLMFWRSFTHYLGGMGVLVFALAVFPRKVDGTVNVMRTEMPGPTFGKLASKIDITAQILYVIYTFMTVTLILSLVLSGLDPFDAMIHGFGTAGTGGFSNQLESIASYNNPVAEILLTIGMFAFSINFYLYYLILVGKGRDVLISEELRAYLILFILATALIALDIRHLYDSFGELMRHVTFTVSSIMSTTGFANSDFTRWPNFSLYILNILVIVGSCAGSTGGGLKISRVLILLKAGLKELKQSISPNRVITIVDEHKRIPNTVVRSALVYVVIYMVTFMLLLFFMSMEIDNPVIAFNTVTSTLNTNAPGVGLVSPNGSYAFVSTFGKIILTFAMLVGRLEIIPVFVLFMPRTYRKRT